MGLGQRIWKIVTGNAVPFHERMRLAREYGDKVAAGALTEEQARAKLRELRVF